MKQRGRKSAAELSAIGSGAVETVRRPEPPADLCDWQADAWRHIVNAHEAAWLTAGAAPVLTQLVRHMDAARKLAMILRHEESGDTIDLDRWQALLRAQDRESARIGQLATRLRLTPQSRYTPHGAAARAAKDRGGAKPWEEF